MDDRLTIISLKPDRYGYCVINFFISCLHPFPYSSLSSVLPDTFNPVSTNLCLSLCREPASSWPTDPPASSTTDFIPLLVFPPWHTRGEWIMIGDQWHLIALETHARPIYIPLLLIFYWTSDNQWCSRNWINPWQDNWSTERKKSVSSFKECETRVNKALKELSFERSLKHPRATIIGLLLT